MLFASFWTGLLMTFFLLTGIFLILLVLIQRGKGGGLVGALGGVGGSSPFGSRAGDLFTRITLAVAGIWILSAAIITKTIQPKATEDPAPGLAAPADSPKPPPPAESTEKETTEP